MFRTIRAALAALPLVLSLATAAQASPLRAGFDAVSLGRNDDGSSRAVQIGFDADFFGQTFTSLFVNNNGNVTFDAPLRSYTPFDLTSTGRPIIAPFFADVDTRHVGDAVAYGRGTVDGRDAFGVTWRDVGFYGSRSDSPDRLNTFQMVLVSRSDTGAGNFDIEFNYGAINWEAGRASGGDGRGLGGRTARAGFSNGTRADGTFHEIAGSGTAGAFLDWNADSGLANTSNVGIDGRHVFTAREGSVTAPPAVPLPAGLPLLLAGIGAIGVMRLRRKRAA
ncbi:MAG: nidogen-like domain-containing protein [Paracoccaceae bacterium]|jgi:hypothetical protein|nr:nidogen-like domain-containing protein [Paracoccaceae bacterium]